MGPHLVRQAAAAAFPPRIKGLVLTCNVSARLPLPYLLQPQILHVSGLMESVTREQLRELFSQAGEVTKVDIPDGGRSMVSVGVCTLLHMHGNVVVAMNCGRLWVGCTA